MPTSLADLQRRARVVAVATMLAALLTALATLAATLWTDAGAVRGARWVVFAAAVATALLGLAKFAVDEQVKRVSDGQKRNLQEEIDAERTRMLVLLGSIFQQAATRLGSLAVGTAEQRQSDVSGFRQLIVEKALAVVRCGAPRASYFRLQAGVPRRMVPEISAAQNRDDEGTSVFVEHSAADQNVWTLLDGDRSNLVRDLDDPVEVPPDFDRTRPRVYRTYITVPVVAGSQPFGILTINALTPGDLTETDVRSMRVLARLLAAGEALVR